MHRVRIFLNENASSSNAMDWSAQISEFLFRSELEFVAPKTIEDLLKELDRATLDKIDVVISVGGDGTFNTLLQRLATTDTSFLVVPAGTANDLARELGLTANLQKALECIRRNDVQFIDILSVNGKLMATNGGIGIVSDVAMSINQWRKNTSWFQSIMKNMHHRVYTLSLVGHLLAARFRHYDLRVSSSEFKGDVSTPLLLINNQPYLAGTFPVAPLTNNSDGKFNVTIFTHKRWSDFVKCIARIKRGLPVGHDPNVISFETTCAQIEVLRGENFSFFGDGEFLIEDRMLEVRIIPNALKVFRVSNPLFQRKEKRTDNGQAS